MQTLTDTAPAAITEQTTKRLASSKNVFFLGLLLAASGLVSPPVALLGGVAFGFTVAHPYRAESATLAKLLLQISVVALGFGINLREVLHAGRAGFLYTAISIATAMTLGLLLGRMLKINRKSSLLITAGTAICGGSAIAALAPIADVTEEEISVSMGTVFLLNSIALVLFPAIGYLLGLNQNQFGLWAALAIHDTSSVVGAAAKYGPQALAVGTTVKLARALWIVPISLITAGLMAKRSHGRRARVQMPWFIALFVLASMASTYIPNLAILSRLGRTGLTATLFLIGTGLSRRTLQQVGVRPLVQGVILWVVIATASLAAIHSGLITI